MPPAYPQRRTAAQMLVLCCAFWAFSFPAMKSLELIGRQHAPGNSSVFFAAWCITLRFGLAAVLVGLVGVRQLRGMTRREWKQGIGLGALGGLGLLLQMDGMAYTQASTSAFLTQGYCVWLPLWFALSRRRKPPAAVMVACLLVLAGGAFLAGVDVGHPHLGRGEWETLAGSVVFTAQILWLERPEFRGNNVLRFSLVMFGILSLCLLPVSLATVRNPADLVAAYGSLPAAGLLAVLVGPCTLFSFMLANRWQPEVPATEAGLLYSTEPVFTAMVALFLPAMISEWSGIAYANERVTWNLIVGGGLVLAANLWLQLGHHSEDSAATPVANETPVSVSGADRESAGRK
ncbi:MAG: DMT family transporter [Verrucomicrobiales bacterium]|nr:DMT family transporter [Verrucomicrobiales bacterium]